LIENFALPIAGEILAMDIELVESAIDQEIPSEAANPILAVTK
jgi:hypothetical protein